MMNNQFYFDHSAATPVDKIVLESMLPYMTDFFYNPSSPYEPAVKVKKAYQDAKHSIAKNLGVKSDEIIITAGATESINLAFNNISGSVAVAPIEHVAVLESAKKHKVNWILVDKNGTITPSAIKKSIDDNVELVSVSVANNEIGTIQKISDIATEIDFIRKQRFNRGVKKPIYLHTDASQGVGQIDINIPRLGVDMLTLNGGKIYGPKQIGLLYVSPSIKIKPLIVGGGQEGNLRSGTENVAGVVGLAKALDIACANRISESKRLKIMRDKIEKALLDNFPSALVSGNKKNRLNSNLHISFANLDAERLIFRLEKKGMFLASGSACSANKGTRSHVLTAIDLPPNFADGSLRITLGKLNHQDSIEEAIKILITEISSEYERINK